MSHEGSFSGVSIVSCGTLRPELRALEAQDFLDADRILFTAPGLHEWPGELEKQLQRQVGKAKQTSEKVIVVYGAKCFVDVNEPTRDVNALVREHGPEVSRVNASNCVDMLADAAQREDIAAGEKVYWLTPGWIANWKFIFKDWDRGKANETFPQNSRAVLLDGIGYYDELIQKDPELLLGFSDFMKIPVEPHPVSLDRLRNLLKEQSLRSA